MHFYVYYLTDYLVEFLDTWLLLAEKMVHPKSILDSVYSLPAKGNTTDYKPFNPTLYLKTILKVCPFREYQAGFIINEYLLIDLFVESSS